jgi:hypothetical protein
MEKVLDTASILKTNIYKIKIVVLTDAYISLICVHQIAKIVKLAKCMYP